jgi:protein involved in polysaccharide export with SLBB domain
MKNTISKVILSLLILFISINELSGQDKRERIGADDIVKIGINYFNYAEKDKVNFEVSVWGFVKSPGKYLIPTGTTFIDLISLSGGPLSEAKLSDIRIVRLKNDSLNIKEDKLILLNYSDFLQDEKIQNVSKTNPVLLPGDIILVPGLQKSTFKENFSLILTALSTIASVAVLLVTVLKN